MLTNLQQQQNQQKNVSMYCFRDYNVVYRNVSDLMCLVETVFDAWLESRGRHASIGVVSCMDWLVYS